jgi:hypothetical protein
MTLETKQNYNYRRDVSLVTEAVTSGARGDTGAATHPRADIMTDMGKVTRSLCQPAVSASCVALDGFDGISDAGAIGVRPGTNGA